MTQRMFFFSVLFVASALVAMQNDSKGSKAEQSPALDPRNSCLPKGSSKKKRRIY